MNNRSSTSQLKCDYCQQNEAPVATYLLHTGPTVQLCSTCLATFSSAVTPYSPLE